jgi:ABC-type branched-subunit amino acid transport system substrate-binding protein
MYRRTVVTALTAIASVVLGASTASAQDTIKIGVGDVTDDDDLPRMGDGIIGTVTSGHYSAAHPSAANKKYVEEFKKLNGMRPNFISVGGYDACT